MYILIFESGAIKQAQNISKDDLDACDKGYLSIVDISFHENPLDYVNGAWEPLEEIAS